jgi:hypothetical protein
MDINDGLPKVVVPFTFRLMGKYKKWGTSRKRE